MRAALLVAVVAFLALFVRTATVSYRSGTNQLERMDRAVEGPAAAPSSASAPR